jgi:hypothetical protein
MVRPKMVRLTIKPGETLGYHHQQSVYIYICVYIYTHVITLDIKDIFQHQFDIWVCLKMSIHHHPSAIYGIL